MDIKKIIIGVLSVLLLALSAILGYILLFNKPVQSQKTAEIKTEKVEKDKSDKKSSKKSSKKEKDKKEESEEKDELKQNDSSVKEQSNGESNDLGIITTSGENVNIESILKDSTTEYAYDASLPRAFKSEEVKDNNYYIEKVKSNSYVANFKTFDLPEKHQEFEKKLSHAFEQFNSYHDQLVEARNTGGASINPAVIELKTLIADDYFNSTYPHDIFEMMLNTHLTPDMTTLKVVQDKSLNHDFALDVVLLNDEGLQFAYMSTLVKNGQFVNPTVFYLREGAIKIDQLATTTQSNQSANQVYE